MSERQCFWQILTLNFKKYSLLLVLWLPSLWQREGSNWTFQHQQDNFKCLENPGPLRWGEGQWINNKSLLWLDKLQPWHYTPLVIRGILRRTKEIITSLYLVLCSVFLVSRRSVGVVPDTVHYPTIKTISGERWGERFLPGVSSTATEGPHVPPPVPVSSLLLENVPAGQNKEH